MKNSAPNLQGQKVLITGGLGFVGSNLAHVCLQHGAEVTIYDSLDTRSGGNLYNIKDFKGSVELVLRDILNLDGLSECVYGKNVIFSCAASTSHPFSMKNPWVDLDVNSKGVLNILEAVRRFAAEAKLIHVGTTTQFGKLIYKPADENHPEFPYDIYSANKSVSEKYVLLYAKAYQIPATVVRLPNVFGPRAAIHSAEFTFNNYFIGLALQGKKVTVYGDGEQLRNVLYIDDAVSALLGISQSAESNGEVFLACGDRHHSVREIAECTVRCIGAGEVVLVDWPESRRTLEVGDAIFTNSKLKATLADWKPRTDLRMGLEATRDYYQSCLGEYLR